MSTVHYAIPYRCEAVYGHVHHFLFYADALVSARRSWSNSYDGRQKLCLARWISVRV